MAAKFGTPETGNEARADDTDQGERLGGVHAVLYPPAIAVLKRGERGGGGFGIKDGIKRAGWKGKVLVRQRIIARFDPSRPSQRAACISQVRKVLTGEGTSRCEQVPASAPERHAWHLYFALQ